MLDEFESPLDVLLVEDDQAFCAVLEMWLEAADVSGRLRLTIADRVGVAVTRLESTPGAWDAVLTDLSLPDARGLETVRRVCAAAHRTVPVVVLTGTDDRALALEALAAGAADFLVKDELSAAVLERTVRFATERHRYEQRLADAHEQLVSAQRLEAVGRLAGGLAHDVNNTLTVILGQTEFLMDEIATRLQDDLRVIREAAQHTSSLISQLLSFSRQQPMRARSTDLADLVRDCARLWGHTLGEDIEVAVETSNDVPPTLVDPGQVRQVLTNLALNARDALPGGGRLIVALRRESVEAPRNVGVSTVRPGDYAVVSVADNGAGMTDEVMGRCFEPFFTTRDEGAGTGLGLSMALGIAQLHKGAISVESAMGRGTTFEVWLPIVGGKGTAVAGLPTPDGPPAVVLVVEDDDRVRDTLQRILGLAGHIVRTADCGAAAREVFDGDPSIELLLSDVVMPRTNALWLARDLQEQRPHLRVLFMSGYSAALNTGARRLPADAPLLQKPFTRREVLSRVRLALNEPVRRV